MTSGRSRRILVASVLLLLARCGAPQVSDIVFPAVAIDADGEVRGHADRASLTTTNRQAIEDYAGRRIIGSDGRQFTITEVRELDPPGMFRDFAGTKPFQVELKMKRGPRISEQDAVAAIAVAIREKPGYLDLTEEGGAAVADEVARRQTIAEVATLLATTYEPRKVTADAIARGNRRVEELARRGE
jgi:hypothetical protein